MEQQELCKIKTCILLLLLLLLGVITLLSLEVWENDTPLQI